MWALHSSGNSMEKGIWEHLMEKGSKQARPSKPTWFSLIWTIFRQLISLEILAMPWLTRPRSWCRTQSDEEQMLVFYQNMSRSQVTSHPFEDSAPKILFPVQTPVLCWNQAVRHKLLLTLQSLVPLNHTGLYLFPSWEFVTFFFLFTLIASAQTTVPIVGCWEVPFQHDLKTYHGLRWALQ